MWLNPVQLSYLIPVWSPGLSPSLSSQVSCIVTQKFDYCPGVSKKVSANDKTDEKLNEKETKDKNVDAPSIYGTFGSTLLN